MDTMNDYTVFVYYAARVTGILAGVLGYLVVFLIKVCGLALDGTFEVLLCTVSVLGILVSMLAMFLSLQWGHSDVDAASVCVYPAWIFAMVNAHLTAVYVLSFRDPYDSIILLAIVNLICIIVSHCWIYGISWLQSSEAILVMLLSLSLWALQLG